MSRARPVWLFLTGLVALALPLLHATGADATDRPPALRYAGQSTPPVIPPAPPAPPRPGAPQPPHTGPTLGENYLMRRYGVGRDEARLRLRDQPSISALAQSLGRDPPPGFAELWVQHDPAYAIVLAFKRAPDKAAVLARADPSIQPFIVFRGATRDGAELHRDLDRIVAVMRGSPPGWVTAHDVRTGKFTITVKGREGLAYAEKNLPADLKANTVIRVGLVPVDF